MKIKYLIAFESKGKIIPLINNKGELMRFDSEAKAEATINKEPAMYRDCFVCSLKEFQENRIALSGAITD